MEINQSDDSDDDFFINKEKEEKIKEQILDENFKKTQKKEKKTKEKTSRKKPFFLLGIVLIIIGASCFVMVEYGPLLYVGYEPVQGQNTTIEKIYYKDFQQYISDDEGIHNFFELNSSEYLGVSPDDFTPYLKIGIYTSYGLILIGAIFTILQIIFRIVEFSYKKSRILHSFFASIAAVIFVYFIFVSTKFFAAYFLYLLNYEIITNVLGNAVIVFIAPTILIFIFAVGLKICFVILKTDYNELESIFESKKPKKSLIDFRYSGGKK